MSAARRISENVRNIKDLQKLQLCDLAKQMKEEERRTQTPKKVIDVSWGDPHSAGVKPLTFLRQVLAACVYPELMDGDRLTADVKLRADKLLRWCVGGSVGSYTNTAGIPEIVHRVTEFIRERDGGVTSNPDNVFISPGSQWSLSNIFKVLVNCEASPPTGVLMPVPCYGTSAMSLAAEGGVSVPYFLCEEEGWRLKEEELQRALQSAEGVCSPVALYVINPGNPVGVVQSRASMQEVIRFVYDRKLFLLADEVYQECVYGENSHFLSYKRVLAEMGAPFSDSVELASFHSVSKGVTGECGLRAGYVELVNLQPAVMEFVYRRFSMDTCTPVLGQIALDVMMNPPRPGEPSYALYSQQREAIRTMLASNAKKATERVNLLQGVSCQPVGGGVYIFPRLYLPLRAIQSAEEAELPADVFYCKRLLQEERLLLSPGTDFQQKEGTFHVRISILVPEELLDQLLTRLTNFHTNFMKEFS